MKTLLAQEFAAARDALTAAAIAVDALQVGEAQNQLRSLQAICAVLLDLLDGLPDGNRDKKLRA